MPRLTQLRRPIPVASVDRPWAKAFGQQTQAELPELLFLRMLLVGSHQVVRPLTAAFARQQSIDGRRERLGTVTKAAPSHSSVECAQGFEG